METCLNLVTARYWDSINEGERTINAIIQGKKLEEVGTELDEWLGEDLIECTVIPLARGALEVSDNIFAELRKEF